MDFGWPIVEDGQKMAVMCLYLFFAPLWINAFQLKYVCVCVKYCLILYHYTQYNIFIAWFWTIECVKLLSVDIKANGSVPLCYFSAIVYS